MVNKGNIRLIDIAGKLNITVNTASKALRGKPGVSDETRKAVKKLAEELGYVPNSLAKGLQSGQTFTVAIIFDVLINPYFMIMADKIHQKLKTLGYDTMIFAGEDGKLEINTLKTLLSRRVDGIITFLEPSDDVNSILYNTRIPTVLIGRKNINLNISTISTDDYKGSYEVGKLFITNGAKNIGYIGIPEDIECSKRRLSGLMQSMIDHGVAYNDANFRFMKTPQIADELNELIKNKVDAIFIFNDMLLLEAYIILKDQGIKVPDDIMLAGFDNIQEELPNPLKITTVASDKTKIIETAVNLLFNHINNKEVYEYQHVEFDVELIVGETTKSLISS